MRPLKPKLILVVSVLAALLTGAFTCRADDAPAATPPPADKDVVKDWNGSVALGLSMTKGNSKTLTANGAFDISKLWKSDEWHFGADGQYGINNFGAKTQEVVNANNIHGLVDYKHLFTERFFGDVRGDAWHDDVADLQNREIIGPALGYFFIKSGASRLSGDIGASFEHQRQGSGTNFNESSFITMHVGEHGEHNWGKQAKVWEDVQYLPKIDDFQTYLLISEAGVEAALNSQFSLRIVLQDRYNSVPAKGRVPNDLALLASLVYKFGPAK